MRLLSVFFICLCFLACSRSNEAKQESRRSDSTTVFAARPESPTIPTVLGPTTFKRDGIFESGQPVDIRMVALRDTILVEHVGSGVLGVQTKGKFVPLVRSFQIAKYQIDSETKDSVCVITEELKAPRNADERRKSEGRLFLAWKGTIAIADTPDVGVEEDSSLSYVVERRVYTPSLSISKSLLVIGELYSPSYPPGMSFRAFGINKEGALVEFPGLFIKESSELPTSLHDGEILTSGRYFGCIGYGIRIRFDMNSCSFVTLPQDSGYEASADVDQQVFNNIGDIIRISVFQKPTSGAEKEDAVFTRGDRVSVTRLLKRGIEVWVLISRNGKVLGWIDDAGIGSLQLKACD